MLGASVSAVRRLGTQHGSARRFWVLTAVCVLAILCLSQRSKGGPVTAPGDSTLGYSGPAEETPGTKSETTALLLSFLGTATAGACAPLVFESTSSDPAAYVLVGALIIGPSLGHFYAGRPGPAFAGIGIRLLAGAAVAVGGLAASSEAGATSGSDAIAAVGVIVGGASVIYDILRAPHSARVHNDEMRQSRIGFGITPRVGSMGVGLSVAATF